LSNSPKPGAVARLLLQLCPNKIGLGANNGLENVGLENMAINSTHSQ